MSLVMIAGLALTPAVAQAGLATSTAPTFPTTVTIGQTGVAASITLENRNTVPHTGDTNIVCNAGDPEPPCDSPENGIILIPSCKQLSGGFCRAIGADPGVFALSATGTGRLGTSCAGTVFDITLIAPVQGTWRFVPRPAGAHVTLPGFGSSCIIGFTLDVLKMPVDQDPGTPGVQTAQQTGHTQVASFIPAALSNSASGTSNGTSFLRAATSIATTASPDITLGTGTLSDTAIVSGRVAPVSGATITFELYGPNDATCAGAVIISSTVPYPVAGGPVTSAAFTPTLAGTYRWRAFYSGDVNNNPVSGACNDANENTVVAPNAPTITTIATVASPAITLGSGTLSDTVNVSGRVNPLAGATVEFRLYGPNDATCSGAPVFQSLGVSYPQGGGVVSSAPFTPTAAGTYRWIASYSGDANNFAATGACNDVRESAEVARATPKIATTASPGVELGAGTLSDTATVTGRVGALPAASIDFRLYGPTDPTCSAAPVFASLGVAYPAAGAPVVTSAPFTPSIAGTYRWIASFSGDANNAPATGACADAQEATVVAPQPTTAPAGLDHFKCYGAQQQRFRTRTVLLRDQFTRARSRVLRTAQICNPVRKNGGAVLHPKSHLVCYATKDRGGVAFRPRNVVVTNQFGKRALSVLAPVSLCVPSLKRKVPGRISGQVVRKSLDHFRCYSVAPQPTPKVVKLADQFGTTSTKVISVVRLCNPVRKNQERAPTRPKARLVCYSIQDAPALHPSAVRVRNQFGRAKLRVGKPQTLCLPSLKQ